MFHHRRETPLAKQFKKKSEKAYQKELEGLWNKVQNAEKKDDEMNEEEKRASEATRKMKKEIASQDEELRLKNEELSATTFALEKARKDIEDLKVSLNNEKNFRIDKEKNSKERVLLLNEEVDHHASQVLQLNEENAELLKKVKEAKNNSAGESKTSD